MRCRRMNDANASTMPLAIMAMAEPYWMRSLVFCVMVVMVEEIKTKVTVRLWC